MGRLTTISIFNLRSNRFWAFKQMALSRGNLKELNGLNFYKILGTGGGKGFSLWPDFSTYALLCVWESEKYFENFRKKNKWYLTYINKSHNHRILFLKPFLSKGLWSGENPFIIKEKLKRNTSKKIVVLTRATLRISKLIRFWSFVNMASNAIKNAEGVEYFKGVGEIPFIQQATVSIWKDEQSINMFAYRNKNHSEIIKKTKRESWYKEDMFTRFELINDINN
tara:strand:+ start:256 stop:927 length:672 start_codon:yes stop_codon:yes gene_type:complete